MATDSVRGGACSLNIDSRSDVRNSAPRYREHAVKLTLGAVWLCEFI